MIIIISIIYYVFLRYSPEQIITYNGYAIEGKAMVESLKNNDMSNVTPYLGLIAVQENDLVYKRLNSYYIGEDDKEEIDINYPIYINDGNALLNLGKNTRLITVNYEEVEGYPDFMMADGVMYNGADITRADGNKYLFLKSADGIYTNVVPITINTANGEYNIKEFSNIYFAEDYIAYYEMEDMQESDNGDESKDSEQNEKNENAQSSGVDNKVGSTKTSQNASANNDASNNQSNNQNNNLKDSYLQYKQIKPIDPDSKTKINGETITYKTLLERLDILQTEEKNNTQNNNELGNTIENDAKEDDDEKEDTETKPEENTVVEETTEHNNVITNQTIINMENNNNDDNKDEWQEGMWEKPEVSCTDFETGVYSATTNLSVRDRAGVISRGVMFELYLDGRLNRRVLATQVGNIEITNLQPSSEYEIKGIFYYTDENGIEQQEEFYNGTATTKSIDTLGTIDFSFQNGEIYSNKIELIHFKVNNNINEEVIKGISRVQVEIGDITYRLSNNQVDDLKAGKEITYQTSESLTSNSKIKYKITAFDRFGNELKAQNNEGETITSKQIPRASIRPTKQDVTEIEIEVTLSNKDNVKVENYRYEITNQSGEVVKQGTLDNKGGTPSDGTKEALKFNDIDPNGYYQIVIYGDYDLEDGTGIHQNAELGRASFVTRPLASLGYMQVRIDDKEITQNSMTLGIKIDEKQTDARLLAILDKVEVVIYDQGKNVESAAGNSNNENTGNQSDNNQGNDGNNNNNNENNQGQEEQKETEVQRITFTQEQVSQLKTAEEVELNMQQLNSNTKYRIDVITTVRQGTVEEVVEDKQNIEQLITLKMPAEVQVRNQFVIGTMIDLDMRIEDPDNAVLTNQVRIEVRNKDNKLVDLSEMPTNAEYERKVYEDLTPNEQYRIIVYAPQYNIGSTDETYEADYILKEIKIVTETGISGRLDLIGLEKTPIGKNLIDVTSKVNWYEKCFGQGEAYGIDYNSDSKILMLKGKGEDSTVGHHLVTYYDLTKYMGQELTISFKARTSIASNLYIIEKTSSDMTDTGRTSLKAIKDLTNNWKEYTCTFVLNKSGYIGFYKNLGNATIEIQDLQIERGNRKTDYEEFKYDYNANVAITVNDARNEITTNDYYIRIYKNNEQIQELRYEEIGEENKLENVQKTYKIESDADYKIELLVKISERFYELDSQKFSTEGGKEIKGIFNLNDFLTIQPYGEYIVLNDIDYSAISSITWAQYSFGGDNNQFNGRVNFNGKSITKDTRGKNIFEVIGKDGVIENVVFNVKLNNGIEVTMQGMFAKTNNGTIRNMQMNLIECTEQNNTYMFFVVNVNRGIIENFTVNLQKPLYVLRITSLIANSNSGIIRNGYVYGRNIKVLNDSSSLGTSAGIIASTNSNNGIIENIFSLIGIDNIVNVGTNKGNIVINNNNNGTIQNVYSVGIGKNTNLAYGPNVYSKSSKKVYNNYYFADEIFISELETKGNKLSLWDTQFQNQLINGDGAFIVDEFVREGYYPQLNMPDCMPAQEYLELPEVKDADLPDILSTKVLEQGTDKVKVQFSINNPASEQISDIEIEYIDVEILSQEYKDGKSTVIAQLKNPEIYVSNYRVISLSTKGAFGSTFKRPYEEGERVINVDLYREVWDVNDWKEINDSPTENYMLMADLNFINEQNIIKLNNVDGIINGNGHTLSNVNLNNASLIANLEGTIKNININNFKQEITTNGGLIAYADSSSTVENVHIKDATIVKTETGYCGGIVNYTYRSTVRDSSVNNLKIRIETEEIPSTLYIGGIVGYSYSTTIENCYSKEIDIQDERAVTSSVGGIIGNGSSESNSIKNCYAEGKINSQNNSVGGIVGASSKIDLQNCYSKVNISTTGTNVGGIIGIFSGTEDTGDISNNLSIGNIFTTVGLNGTNRIMGNSSEITDNYAYENQLINGYATKDEKGAILLNEEEILNLDLGTSYNYDEKSKGVLPKLYNVEGTALLPNQTDIYVDDSLEADNVKLVVENIETMKPNSTDAEITLRISNPAEIEVTSIEIEDMDILSIERNVTQNGITSITARTTPTRYYDSYKLTGIKYKDNSGKEQIKKVENEIQIQFYKEIYTFEDWQSIEEGTFQNYRLMADIDFSGKANIKNNITVNRLEAENNIYTIKNIELEFNNANSGLINNIKTSIKNIGFENIALTNTKNSGEYFGIIATNYGKVENLTFNNITIKTNGMDYVGMIGRMSIGSIRNIELNDITVNGKNYVGGLAGDIALSTSEEIKEIVGDNITVTGTGNYVGGIIGHQTGDYIEESNITIKNSSVTGNDDTGGVFGLVYNAEITYIEVTNTEIIGKNYVGGYAGYNNASSDNFFKRYYIEINSCEITGKGNQIGGVTGFISLGIARFWSVHNTTIQATSSNAQNIGGLSAVGSWNNLQSFEVVNTEIKTNGSNVGGVTGKTNGTTTAAHGIRGIIENCVIEGKTNVGGVIGLTNYGYYYNVSVNADIKANTSNAGGIIGYMNNQNMTASRYDIQVYNNVIVDTKVTAPTNAGGLIGTITKEIYRDQSFYYNNYIDAEVTSTNTSTGSLIIGGRPDENSYIKNTYVYKYSTLNSNYVYATNDNIGDDQYLVRTDLNNQSTFSSKIGLGTNYWNYTSLAEGKYPKIKDTYLYNPELQNGVNLPVDPEIAEISLLSETGDKYDGDENNGNKNDVGAVNSNGQNNLTAQNNIDAENITALPDYKVYPISANEINVDFSGVISDYNAKANVSSNSIQSETKLITNEVSSKENTVQQQVQNSDSPSSIINFTYYINGQEQEKVELSSSTNQTYTFKYNFMDTIEIKLTRKNNLEINNIAEGNQVNLTSNDGTNSSTTTITITPEDVRSETSLVGNDNAYLLGTNLYINGELQQGEYVNVYEGKALNSSGQVVDIATKQVIQSENVDSGVNVDSIQEYNENANNNEKTITQDTTYLEETPKPLHTYEYKGKTIEVYGTYSKINGNIKTQIYNVRSGKLSALSNSLDMKIGNSITDNYNNKEYQTILNTSGELIDLKEKLQYPDNFLSRNIKQIVQNIDEEKTEIMVLYNTGKAIVYNYVTGEVIYENNKKADDRLSNYLAGNIENIWNDYEEKQQEYAKSKELEQKLAELPIEKALEQVNEDCQNNSQSENSNNGYITVYNAETGEYEVYSEEEILNSNDEIPVSETEKITQNGLEGVYGYNAKEETKPQTNGGVIMIAIIAVAIVALIILRKVVIKNNTKE